MLKEKGFDNDIIKDANKMYAYLLKEKTAKAKDVKENVKKDVNVNKKDVLEDNLKEKNWFNIWNPRERKLMKEKEHKISKKTQST